VLHVIYFGDPEIALYVPFSQGAEVQVCLSTNILIPFCSPFLLCYYYALYLRSTDLSLHYCYSMARTSFTEDDWKLVQLVLTLFRNVLATQEIT
jgi:hypothetical protein